MKDKKLSENQNIYNASSMNQLFVAKKYKELNDAALSNLELKPNDFDNLNALAVSYKLLGNIKKAEETFGLLLKLGCKNDYILSNAGNFYYDTGRIDYAKKCHEEAIKSNPNNLNSLNQLGLCLSNQGKDKEAIEYYKKSLSVNDKDVATHINIANSYRNLGSHQEAANYYEFSDDPLARCQQLECFYLLGDKDLFNDKLSKFSELNKPHPLAATLSSHASIRYDQNDNFSFCNKPFEFIEKSNLFKSKDIDNNLITEFIDCFNKLKISKKQQSLLANGYQSSGNIFIIDQPPIQRLKKIIMKKIEGYKKKYNDGSATFLTQWPERYILYGWIIVIENGGNLSGHMHKEGWLSGSLYLERPEKNEEHDGDIIFSLHGSNYPLNNKNYPSKIINIDKGDLVLFPSSLFHATIPFSSNKKRITLAFDIIPKT